MIEPSSKAPRPALALSALLLALWLPALGACSASGQETLAAQPIPEYDARDSATESFQLLKQAVARGHLNRFFYLLDHAVRDRIPFATLARAWEDERDDTLLQTLKRTIAQAEVIGEEPLATRLLPVGPNVVLRIRRPDTEGNPVTETLLFVLEHDPARWPGEERARWRVRYPWPTFQKTDEWFAALGLALPEEYGPEGGTPGGTPGATPGAIGAGSPNAPEDLAPAIPVEPDDLAPAIPVDPDDTGDE